MDQEILVVSFYVVRCSALGAQFTKMAANGSVKAFCVLTFHECRSVTVVQGQFLSEFGEEPPSDNSIRRYCAQFQDTGCVCKRKSTAIETITADMLQTNLIIVLMFVESQTVNV
jgi:hypothetical protein